MADSYLSNERTEDDRWLPSETDGRTSVQHHSYSNDNNAMYDPDRIFVGRLPHQATEESIRWYFEKFGPVRSVETIRDKKTGTPRGIAFVIFEHQASVEAVLRESNHEIHHALVDVKLAQVRAVSRPRVHERSPSSFIRNEFLPERNYGNSESGGQKNLAGRWVAPTPKVTNVDTIQTDVREPSASPLPMYGKIFCGGLPPEVDRNELKIIFEQFGDVADTVVMMDQAAQRSRGFGFVTFNLSRTPHAIDRAMRAQPVPVHGRDVQVKIATAFENGGGGGDESSHSGSTIRNSQSEDANRAQNLGPSESSAMVASESESVYCKMFVGGLPPQVDRIELKYIFEQFGVVADAVVMMDQATQRSRCFGFVTFDIQRSPKAPQQAMQCQPLPVHGRDVEIKYAENFVSHKSLGPSGDNAPSRPVIDSSRQAASESRALVETSDRYCKMFVGGLPPQIDRSELIYIFEQFGAVADAVVMVDPASQRSRGFGFVTFDIDASPDAPQRAIRAQPLPVHGRSVEVKMATAFVATKGGGGEKREGTHLHHEGTGGRTMDRGLGLTDSGRENSGFEPSVSDHIHGKVFVGGLPPQVNNDDLRLIFEQFGPVADAAVMMDEATQRSRCFGFVTFDPRDGRNSAQRAVRAQPLPIHGRDVQVKLAMPRTDPASRTDGPHNGVKRSTGYDERESMKRPRY